MALTTALPPVRGSMAARRPCCFQVVPGAGFDPMAAGRAAAAGGVRGALTAAAYHPNTVDENGCLRQVVCEADR